MKALIVSAHPSTTSYNNALKEALKSGLIEANYEILETDLYRDNFNPIIHESDYPSYTEEDFNVSEAQEKASHDKVYDREIQEEMDKITQCNLLVLQFPVWWFTCPAIMTGWLQRAFPLGFGIPDGNLAGRKVLISATTGPSQEIYVKSGYKSMDEILYHITQCFVLYGMEVLPLHITWNVNGMTPEQREEAITNLQTFARNINNS